MKDISIKCGCFMDLSASQLLDIAREALKEVPIEDLHYGIGDGEVVFIRYEVDEPRWFKVYVYKIGSTTFIDSRMVPDEEVMVHGRPVSKV